MSVLLAPFAFLRLLTQSALLALGQIWANKLRSVLTTTGIIIGVASVTAVVAGLTGLKTKVLGDFEAFGTNRIGVWARRPDTGPMRRADWFKIVFRPEQFEGLLEHCPSVACYSRQAYPQWTVRRGEHSLDEARITAIDPAWHKVNNRAIIAGRPFTEMDEQDSKLVCIITPDVRDKLLLDKDCVGQKIIMDNRSFTVVGVVEPPAEMSVFRGANGAQMEVFVPFTTGYSFGNWMDIDAGAKSPEVAEEAKAEIAFFLRGTRRIRPGEPNTFEVQTVARILETFNGIALAVTAVAGGIVAVSLLVGGIGISNIMLVSVSERTREIGLRKAVGARSSAILLQFLVEAVMLCLVGGLAGVVAGWLLTKGIASIPNAQLDKAYIPFWAVELSFGFSTAVGLIFGMFPAIKAARLDPIDALRHE